MLDNLILFERNSNIMAKLSILGVCHQIFDETTSIFYGKNTFFVKSVSINSWYKRCGSRICYVKKLALYLDYPYASATRQLVSVNRIRELYLDINWSKIKMTVREKEPGKKAYVNRIGSIRCLGDFTSLRKISGFTRARVAVAYLKSLDH
jgi:hypothetical protein